MLGSRWKRACAALLFLFCQSAFAAEQNDGNLPISITEINLNWFGLEGGPNVDKETRSASIKQFLTSNRLMTDVMIFVEIVDIRLLESAVLGSGYQCHSYNRPDPKHQHVVICNSSLYRFDMADGEKSYALEGVDVTGRLRPAVHGILKSKNGTKLAHIFALHLKAMPDQSAMRLRQTKIISDYLATQQSQVPVIITGDVNTFGDDAEKMDEILSKNELVPDESPEPYSWASASESFEPAKFDRVWVSAELQNRVVSNHIIGPCNTENRKELAAYNKAVSDHCAVHFKIDM